MKHLTSPNKSGFTFLEVILSIGILTTAVVALLGVMQNIISASSQIERQSHVLRNLESRLSEIRSQYIEPGKQTTESDLWGVFYEAEITALELFNQKEQPLSGLFKVVIRAKWKQGKIDMQEQCEIFAYQP